MRRRDREILDFGRMTEILSACDIASVAMVDFEGLPYVVPVNFGFSTDGETVTLYFHGAREGKKAELLKKNASVSACMYRGLGKMTGRNACDFGLAFESVMAFGHALVLESEADKIKALKTLMAKMTEEDLPFHKAALARTEVFAIPVEHWTAKERLPKE